MSELPLDVQWLVFTICRDLNDQLRALRTEAVHVALAAVP